MCRIQHVPNWNVQNTVYDKLQCAVHVPIWNVPYICQTEMCVYVPTEMSRICANWTVPYMCQTELCRICDKLKCSVYVSNCSHPAPPALPVPNMCQTVLTLCHLHCLCQICAKLYSPCARCCRCSFCRVCWPRGYRSRNRTGASRCLPPVLALG